MEREKHLPRRTRLRRSARRAEGRADAGAPERYDGATGGRGHARGHRFRTLLASIACAWWLGSCGASGEPASETALTELARATDQTTDQTTIRPDVGDTTVEPPRGYVPNGRLLQLEPLDLSHDESLAEVWTTVSEDGRWRDGYDYLEGLAFYRIVYASDDLRVHGFAVAPRTERPLPSLVYLRGGNRELGALTPMNLVHRLAVLASHGFAVVATQYRGNGGSEGQEEFGGADVHDVLNLFPVLAELPFADEERIALYGGSRGGTMVYETLAQTDRALRAAVVVSGPTDQDLVLREVPELEDHLFRQIVPDFETDRARALAVRSPVRWAQRLPTTTPLLIMHGRRDDRVSPEHALRMALALGQHEVPYRLVILQDAGHGMHDPEVVDETVAFLERYLVPAQPVAPPPLEAHVH